MGWGDEFVGMGWGDGLAGMEMGSSGGKGLRWVCRDGIASVWEMGWQGWVWEMGL